MGDKIGYIKATLEFALNRDDLKTGIRQYLRQLAEEEFDIDRLKKGEQKS